MTDNEIIKALECCNNESESCVDCPLWKFDKCVKRLQKSALDLINRQKAEIERLQSMNQAKLDTIHDLMAEVERLNQPILVAKNVEINKEEFLEKLQQSPIQPLPIEKQYELRDCPFSPFDEYCTGHCVNCENRLECVDCSKRLKSKAIKNVLLTLESEAESSDKYIREYDDSEVQKAYNQALWQVYNIVRDIMEESK